MNQIKNTKTDILFSTIDEIIAFCLIGGLSVLFGKLVVYLIELEKLNIL